MIDIVEVLRRLFTPAPRMSDDERLRHLVHLYHDAGMRAKAEQSIGLARVADARWRQLVTLRKELGRTESTWAIYRSIIKEEEQPKR